MTRGYVFLLTSAIAFQVLSAGCKEPGVGEDGDVVDDIEDGQAFSFAIQLVPAVGYEPEADVSYLNVEIGTEPLLVFDNLEVPQAPDYLIVLQLDGSLSGQVVPVSVNGYRAETGDRLLATGRCPPIRLGDWVYSPEGAGVRVLKIFFHKVERFMLIPPEQISLSEGKIGMRAFVHNDGRIMVLGGASLSGVSGAIEAIDMRNFTCEVLSTDSLPSARSEFGLIPMGGGKYLLIGGRTYQSYADLIIPVQPSEESPSLFEFSRLAVPDEINSVWANPRFASLSDGSFIVGGADTGAQTASGVYVKVVSDGTISKFDISLDGTQPDTDKYHPTLNTVNVFGQERVLIYGGGGSLPTALLLDPLTGEAEDLHEPTGDGRYDHGASTGTISGNSGEITNQFVVIMGGEQKLVEGGSSLVDRAILFIPECLEGECVTGSAWNDLGPIFTGHLATQGSIVSLPDGRIAYIGGRGEDGDATDSVIIFTADTPSRIDSDYLTLSVPRVSPEVLYYELTGQIFVIGGEGAGGEPVDSVEVFTPLRFTGS